MNLLKTIKRKIFPPEAYRPIPYEGMRRVNPNIQHQAVVSDFADLDEGWPLQIFLNGKWEDM